MPREAVIKYRLMANGLTRDDYNKLRKIIQDIHNDPRSWRKYGYHFQDHSHVPFTKPKDQIRVYFMCNDDLVDHFDNDMNGLSVYSDIGGENSIYFNIERFRNGGVDPFPGSPKESIQAYRTYVVNHEFGHALGLPHPSHIPITKTGKGSVMQQMTKGLKHIYPNKLNEWPLEFDVDGFDEMHY